MFPAFLLFKLTKRFHRSTIYLQYVITYLKEGLK